MPHYFYSKVAGLSVLLVAKCRRAVVAKQTSHVFQFLSVATWLKSDVQVGEPFVHMKTTNIYERMKNVFSKMTNVNPSATNVNLWKLNVNEQMRIVDMQPTFVEYTWQNVSCIKGVVHRFTSNTNCRKSGDNCSKAFLHRRMILMKAKTKDVSGATAIVKLATADANLKRVNVHRFMTVS